MQQTFQINTDNLNANFIQSVRAWFGHREVKITVEDVEPEKRPSQREIFLKMEKHREKLSHIKVDPKINLSDLANEMLDTPI